LEAESLDKNLVRAMGLGTRTINIIFENFILNENMLNLKEQKVHNNI
jgi:hypothetical protein